MSPDSIWNSVRNLPMDDLRFCHPTIFSTHWSLYVILCDVPVLYCPAVGRCHFDFTSSSVFCPKAGPSLQSEKPSLQFCWRQVFHRKLRNQGCSFTRDLAGVVASHCFPHPTLSLESEQTLKDLKRPQGHQRGGEENGFG